MFNGSRESDLSQRCQGLGSWEMLLWRVRGGERNLKRREGEESGGEAVRGLTLRPCANP